MVTSITILILLWNLYLVLVGAEYYCPNDCSGVGKCGAYGICTCPSGYSGPDCSKRKIFINFKIILLIKIFAYMYTVCMHI